MKGHFNEGYYVTSTIKALRLVSTTPMMSLWLGSLTCEIIIIFSSERCQLQNKDGELLIV